MAVIKWFVCCIIPNTLRRRNTVGLFGDWTGDRPVAAGEVRGALPSWLLWEEVEAVVKPLNRLDRDIDYGVYVGKVNHLNRRMHIP